KLGLRPDGWRQRDKEAWRRRYEDPNARRIDAIHELRRVDGIWYEATYNRAPNSDDLWLAHGMAPPPGASKPKPRAYVYDLVKRERVPAYYRHAVHKRQLSGSELQRFDLINEAPE